MSTRTIGFAVAEEDQEQLDELVRYFGGGNRSAYLRATLKVMQSMKLAEELREIQAYGQGRLAAKGIDLDDIATITRQVLKGKE
jgi:Arc/MetJ-type ribon-helix-helix transcriptional regulator